MALITDKYLLTFSKKNKKILTPSRKLIIKVLSKHNKPKSAYELHSEVNKIVNDYINISTIYRVLDFWTSLKLVHKITSLNKFLLCSNPNEKHTHMLNYCTSCEKVIEICSKVVSASIQKSSAKYNLYYNKKNTLEIPVICSSCS